MSEHRRARRHDQTAIPGALEGRDGSLDLGRVAHVDRAQLNAERRRRGLDRTELTGPGGYGGIAKNGHSLHARRDLLEQLQPLSTHAVFIRGETRDVAARSRQAVDEAGADRIGGSHEHHRHGAGRLQHHPRGRGAAGQNEVGRERDQFRRVGACAVSVTVGKATKDLDIEAVGPAQLVQRLQERPDAGLSFGIVRGQA